MTAKDARKATSRELYNIWLSLRSEGKSGVGKKTSKNQYKTP